MGYLTALETRIATATENLRAAKVNVEEGIIVGCIWNEKPKMAGFITLATSEKLETAEIGREGLGKN